MTIITLAEIFPAPIRLTEGPIRPAAAWATWLDSQPEGTIVAHIPFPKSGRTTDLEQTATWMILQMWHGQPMVNGYSGFFPASYRLLARKMENFPDYDSLDALEQRNVSYILIDREWMDSRSRRTLESLRDCLMPIHYSSTLIVFELTDVVDCS